MAAGSDLGPGWSSSMLSQAARTLETFFTNGSPVSDDSCFGPTCTPGDLTTPSSNMPPDAVMIDHQQGEPPSSPEADFYSLNLFLPEAELTVTEWAGTWMRVIPPQEVEGHRRAVAAIVQHGADQWVAAQLQYLHLASPCSRYYFDAAEDAFRLETYALWLNAYAREDPHLADVAAVAGISAQRLRAAVDERYDLWEAQQRRADAITTGRGGARDIALSPHPSSTGAATPSHPSPTTGATPSSPTQPPTPHTPALGAADGSSTPPQTPTAGAASPTRHVPALGAAPTRFTPVLGAAFPPLVMVRIAVLPKASLNAARLDRSPAGEHYPTRAGALSPATTAVAAVEPSQDVPRSDALQAAPAIELAQVGRTSLAPPSPPMPPHLPPPMVPDAVAIAAALPPTQLPQLLGDAVGAAAADAPMPAQQTLPLGDAVGAAEAGAASLAAAADAPQKTRAGSAQARRKRRAASPAEVSTVTATQPPTRTDDAAASTAAHAAATGARQPNPTAAAEPLRDEPRGVAGKGVVRRRWADSDSDDDAPELPWPTRAGASRHVAFVCRSARGASPPPQHQQEPAPVPSTAELLAMLKEACERDHICYDDLFHDDSC